MTAVRKGHFPQPRTAMLHGEAPIHPLLGLAPSLNHTARVVYRFDCKIGCAPLPPFICDAIVRTAVLDACRMALSTARKLGARPPDAATATLFRSVFDHDPWEPFPGTWNIASGDVASCQFRMVESALRWGNVLYRCDPCTTVREDPSASIILDVHAIAIPAQNVVLLCPSFWQLSRILKAGMLLHEMFHLRFQPFFQARREGKKAEQRLLLRGLCIDHDGAHAGTDCGVRVTSRPRHVKRERTE